MNWPASISLLGLGYLIGFAFGEAPISEQPPPIKAPQRVMADEIPKPEYSTCQYTRPGNRGTYTVAIHRGETCLVVLGD